ncbi:hypothetical protein QYM36_014661, partial [Artemia franciscana]
IVLLSDLENDMINVLECCERLNFWVGPHIAVNFGLTVIPVLTGDWFVVAMTLPVGAYVFYQYFTTPRGNSGVFEPTDLLKQDVLRGHLWQSIILAIIYIIYLAVFFS